MSELSIGRPERVGPLDLLVIQPTPFCNIDCSYCYLPTRQSKERMAPEVLDAVFERVFTSGLVKHRFTVVWHAGEPLVLPVAFYERALAIVDAHNAGCLPVDHSFQTNGTLITQAWCDFIKANPVRIGVSLDGPAFLHDAFRKTREGLGTHRRVMEGVRRLRENAIPFHVIAVLTRPSLDFPDEMYDFFVRHEVRDIGFNVEEIEGPHRSSSLQSDDIKDLYARFLSRFYDLAAADGWPLRVREFDSTLAAIFSAGDPGLNGDPPRGHEITPLAIISVDCHGRFSSFSPELLGLPSAHYGDFVLGRVTEDDFASVLEAPKFRAIQADIDAGVERCRQECSYFALCGGGAPVNKYFENGTFVSTETLFCRLNRQALLEVVLDKVEQGRVLLPPRPACVRADRAGVAGIARITTDPCRVRRVHPRSYLRESSATRAPHGNTGPRSREIRRCHSKTVAGSRRLPGSRSSRRGPGRSVSGSTRACGRTMAGSSPIPTGDRPPTRSSPCSSRDRIGSSTSSRARISASLRSPSTCVPASGRWRRGAWAVRPRGTTGSPASLASWPSSPDSRACRSPLRARST